MSESPGVAKCSNQIRSEASRISSVLTQREAPQRPRYNELYAGSVRFRIFVLCKNVLERLMMYQFRSRFQVKIAS